MDDERLGHTSASSAERHTLCPASFLLECNLPETKSREAESGTRIHEALATGNTDGLSVDELETYQACIEVEAWSLGEWTEYELEKREERFWLQWNNADGKTFRHSGKVDRIYVAGNRARISDFKTGRSEPPESSKNLQLRELAALAFENWPVTEVTVVIIQPWVTRKPVACLYTKDDLELASQMMKARVEANHDPKAKRIPSEAACRFCRGRALCPEFLGQSLPVTLNVEPPVPTEADIRQSIAALDGMKLGTGLGMARMLADVFEAETRARLDRGDPVDGWHLAPGRTRETITDPQAVFSRFIGIGGSQADFMAAVTVAKGKLKEAVKTTTGAKGKALDAEMERLLAGATESKVGSPVLERV